MSDVKTLKIKKPTTPPPPSPTQEVAPPPDAPTAEPSSGGVVLPKYAQAARTGPTQTVSSASWTAWAIVATVAVLLFAALVVIQLLELNFYATPPSCWTTAGMF
jgi:hypothetical protein